MAAAIAQLRVWARFWWHSRLFIRKQRLAWWQRRPPGFEFKTRIYVGLPGSGKTLYAVRDAIMLLRRDVRVFANLSIRDPVSGREAVKIASWFDVLKYSVEAVVQKRPTVFVIDEIHLWANSRFYGKSPGWWFALMAQSRHYGVGIIGTTQNLARCEIVVRELVDHLVFVGPSAIGAGLTTAMRWATLGRFKGALPWYSFKSIAPQILGDASVPPRDAPGGSSWLPWWVFGGYSTKELVAVHEWADDAETTAEVERLTEYARTVVAPDVLPCLWDDFDEVA